MLTNFRIHSCCNYYPLLSFVINEDLLLSCIRIKSKRKYVRFYDYLKLY